MSRIRIEPPAAWLATIELPIRITDLNFGNHVGNDAWVGLLHEARAQFLALYGWTELQFAGTGLIMADLGLEFKRELFYPGQLQVRLGIGGHSAVGFDLVYQMEVKTADGWATAGMAKTGMLCYDYEAKKLARLPELVLEKWALKG